MKVLTRDELADIAPAIVSNSHNRTDAYRQVQTIEVIDALAGAGYLPVTAGSDNPRTRNPNHVTHFVTLWHESYLCPDHGHAEVPQLTVLNSHNGRTRMRFFAGFFRIACTNGLVVGDPDFTAQVTHRGDARVEALGYAEEMTEAIEGLRANIDRWSRVELSKGEAERFALDAAALRFGSSSAAYAAEDLLRTRREDDDGLSLWQVFNRLQENTVKGGLQGLNRSTNRRVRAGELTSVKRSNRYNRELWNLADAVARAKA